MLSHRAAGIALVLWLSFAATARPDGAMINGVSPRSISRGGTNLGFADNAGILFDNPAAMVNIEKRSLFELGTNMVLLNFRYADPANSATSVSFTPLPELGLIEKSSDGDWAYGIGVFAPAGFSESYTLEGPAPLVGPHRYKSFGALVKVLPGISHRLTDRLAIGGTLGVGISYAELQGPYFIQSAGPFHGMPTEFNVLGSGAAPIWSAGLQYTLTERTIFGATYQSASAFNLRGNAHVDVGGAIGNYDSQLRVTWPQSAAVGFKHAFCAHRRIAADLIWYDWSSAFDQLDVTLSNSSNPNLPYGLSDSLPLDWRDSVSIRLGFEESLAIGGTFRLGYVYHRDPIPNDTLTPFIQAFLQHSISVGYGWRWNSWDVDLGYTRMLAPTEYVGVSRLAGGDFDHSRHRAQVDLFAIGLVRSF